jgi:hypothetical protein
MISLLPARAFRPGTIRAMKNTLSGHAAKQRRKDVCGAMIRLAYDLPTGIQLPKLRA